MRGSEYGGRDRIMRKVLNAKAGDNVHPAEDLFALNCMIALTLQKTAGRMAPCCEFPKAMEEEESYLERAKGFHELKLQQQQQRMYCILCSRAPYTGLILCRTSVKLHLENHTAGRFRDQQNLDMYDLDGRLRKLALAALTRGFYHGVSCRKKEKEGRIA